MQPELSHEAPAASPATSAASPATSAGSPAASAGSPAAAPKGAAEGNDGAENATGPQRPLVERWLRAFGAFWWDFLIGDTPELFVGALIAIGVLAVLAKAVTVNAAAVAVFPVLVVVLLAASLARERRAKK